MAQADFALQLRGLGYDVEERSNGRVSFRYVVPSGKLAAREFLVGYDVPGDFPITPPGGPHVSPKVHPNQSGGTHPTGGVHDSPFGPDWQYWSRPMHHWPQTKRAVRDVIAHLNRLFDTQ